jgi:hypothetical protein
MQCFRFLVLGSVLAVGCGPARKAVSLPSPRMERASYACRFTEDSVTIDGVLDDAA